MNINSYICTQVRVHTIMYKLLYKYTYELYINYYINIRRHHHVLSDTFGIKNRQRCRTSIWPGRPSIFRHWFGDVVETNPGVFRCKIVVILRVNTIIVVDYWKGKLP